MEKFELHILGCGSALPTTRHFATSQVVNLREKLFMIDCGEGAQMQLRRSRLKFSRLNHIFISHLHGDHCFGLLGLISTFGLLGRTADLHIHSPEGLEELFAPMLAFFCKTLTYKVLFHEFETKEPALIYDDRSVTVTTIPLKHRIPCCGFLFEEKQRPRALLLFKQESATRDTMFQGDRSYRHRTVVIDKCRFFRFKFVKEYFIRQRLTKEGKHRSKQFFKSFRGMDMQISSPAQQPECRN